MPDFRHLSSHLASSSPQYSVLDNHPPVHDNENTLQTDTSTPLSPPEPFASSEIGSIGESVVKSDDVQPVSNDLNNSQCIRWRTPALVFLLFILGVGSALGHYAYCNSLDGLDVEKGSEQQVWAIRIGTGLAFLSRASLAAVVGISRRQWLWATLRKRFMTLEGIDAMFGVTSDITFFKNRDMLKQAPFVTLMAVLIWMFPLVAIVTPSALTVVPFKDTQSNSCAVRTIQFDFGSEPSSQKLNVSSTSGNTSSVFFTLADSFGGNYQQPSMMARKIFTISAFTDRIATPSYTGNLNSTRGNETDIGEFCYDRSCNYNVSFLAPHINCTEKSSNQTNDPWASHYFNTSVFDAGVWENDTLWIRYIPQTVIQNWTDLQQFQHLGKQVCSCKSSIARYTVKLDLQNNTFREPEIIDVKVHEKAVDLMNKTYEPNRVLFDVLAEILRGNVAGISVPLPTDQNSSDTCGDAINSAVSAHLSSPFKRATDYSANSAVSVANAQLNCYLSRPGLSYESGKLVNQTQVGATALSSASYKIVHPISEAIETMAQKMVVSLLAADSPGTRDDKPLMEYAALENTFCTSTKFRTIFQFKPTRLVLAYGIAVIVTLCMAGCGLVALERNGVSSDANFSTILRATRNPTLDEMITGGCLGGGPLPKELGRLRLRFGDIGEKEKKSGSAYGHVAMGVKDKDTVWRIDKAKHYL